jgi:hypothetical protein
VSYSKSIQTEITEEPRKPVQQEGNGYHIVACFILKESAPVVAAAVETVEAEAVEPPKPVGRSLPVILCVLMLVRAHR